MIEQAHAKINLSLNITHRRADGYHELQSIFLPLAMHDTLEIQIADKTSIVCDDSSIPVNESNLIWKAITLIQSKYNRDENFAVKLTKRIPAMAGLGGGSSNAAAMLRAMNAMLELQLSDEELIDVAKQLGADVPFFLKQKPAYVSGIGEKLEVISFPFDLQLLLVKPSSGISTKEAYETLSLKTCDHPDINELLRIIENKEYDTMVSVLGNSLEQSAFLLIPEIQTLKLRMQSMGFDAVLMSGSGSTIFAVSKNEKQIDDAMPEFLIEGLEVWKTRIKV